MARPKRLKMKEKEGFFHKSDYLPFLEEIKGKIKSARIQAYRKANKELILLYWEIGERIVEKQEQGIWRLSVSPRPNRRQHREHSENDRQAQSMDGNVLAEQGSAL